MGIDAAYNDLLTWLNAHGAPEVLRPLRVLNRGTHRWMEFVAAGACSDAAAVEPLLTCRGSRLPGVYPYSRNRLPRREHHRSRRTSCSGGLRNAAWYSATCLWRAGIRWLLSTQELIRDSVLSSILLPDLDAGVHGGGMAFPCGLCDYNRKTPEHKNRWTRIDADRMALTSVWHWPEPGFQRAEAGWGSGASRTRYQAAGRRFHSDVSFPSRAAGTAAWRMIALSQVSAVDTCASFFVPRTFMARFLCTRHGWRACTMVSNTPSI